MKFPLLELDDGTRIFESTAIAAHFGRGKLFGSTPFQNGQCEQWIAYTQGRVWPTVFPVLMAVLDIRLYHQKNSMKPSSN